jgi:hypothetical protein
MLPEQGDAGMSPPSLRRPTLALTHKCQRSRPLAAGGQSDIGKRHVESVENDAVVGAHSAASMCRRVVASTQTTMRGAVHGRG